MNRGPHTRNLALRSLMSEYGLTERALADAVNAVLHRTGAAGTLTDRHVRRWLSGEVTAPWPHYLTALESVLGTDLLGFRTRRRPEPPKPSSPATDPPDQQEIPPVLRRRFVLASAAAPLSATLPTSGRIGLGDVARVRAAMEHTDRTDDLSGGAPLVDTAERLATHVGTAMGHSLYGPTVETDLYRLLAELRANAGWYAFDAGDNARAERNYEQALRMAMLARDRQLQARVWAALARHAWEVGRPAETIGAATAGLHTSRHGRDPRLGALLHCRLALGYAQARRPAQTGRALARAETLLDRAGHSLPWLEFCTADELLGAGAMAHMALGQPRHALALEMSIPEQPIGRFRRNHYAKLIHTAQCQLAAGHAEESLTTAGDALDLLPDVTCPRWNARLRRYRDAVATTGAPGAGEFLRHHDTVTAATAKT